MIRECGVCNLHHKCRSKSVKILLIPSLLKLCCDQGHKQNTRINYTFEEMKIITVIAVILILVAGCYWDNVEELFPDVGHCDTLDVSFTSDVVPILRNNCFSCHSNTNSPDFANGLSLEDYEDVSAMSDRIVGAIKHNDGFFPMPQGNEQLDSCQIETIEAWVNQGSLNN
jgi:hypothetical protein